MIREASIFRSPFTTSSIYRDPFHAPPAYTQLHRHWLWSPLGARHFIDLLWPRRTFEAVVEAVAEALITDVRARRRKGDGA